MLGEQRLYMHQSRYVLGELVVPLTWESEVLDVLEKKQRCIQRREHEAEMMFIKETEAVNGLTKVVELQKRLGSLIIWMFQKKRCRMPIP